jgi:hypothetical protein
MVQAVENKVNIQDLPDSKQCSYNTKESLYQGDPLGLGSVQFQVDTEDYLGSEGWSYAWKAHFQVKSVPKIILAEYGGALWYVVRTLCGSGNACSG